MSCYVLTLAVQADIAEIWDYTAELWSLEQATAYIRAIQEACDGLASGMRISWPVDVKLGYLKNNVKSHFIIFRRDDAGLVTWFAFCTAAWMWSAIFDSYPLP